MQVIRKIVEKLWWLRLNAIAFHAYVFFSTRFTLISCAIYSSRHGWDFDGAVHILARKSIAIGQKVERRPLPSTHSPMYPYRLWLRFAEFSTLLLPFILLPAEIRAGLDDDEIRALVRYGELAIQMYVSGGEGWVATKATHSKRMPPRVRTTLAVAGIYQMVAAAYLTMAPNDAAHAFSIATNYLHTAAEKLEDCTHPEAAWLAGKVWGQMGEAYLNFPFDPHSITNSLNCLERAAKVLEPYLQNLKGPPIPLDGGRIGQTLNSEQKRLVNKYISTLIVGRRRTRLGGTADPQYAWFRLASLAQDIDRQMGVIRGRQGDLQGALVDLRRALTRYDDLDAQALIQVEIGYVYLEHGASDKSQLNLAVQAFSKVIEQQSELKRRTPLIRALIGSAFAVLQYYQLVEGKERKRIANGLDVSAKNLRIAIEAAKESSLIELCQEATYTLGLIRMNRREYGPAYRAFSLSSRLLDRLRRRSRTLRSKRFRIGTSISLYNNLLYVAARYERLNRRDGTPGTYTPGSMALRSCRTFSERGRSIFLDAALASRDLRPRSGSIGDFTEFFTLRRAWHQAEINLETRELLSSENEYVAALVRGRSKLEQRYFQELDRLRTATGDPSYDPDRAASPVRFATIQKTLNRLSEDATTALIEYHVSHNRIHIVLVLPTSRGRGSSTSHRELVIDINEISESLYGHKVSDPTVASVWNWIHWGNGRLRQLLETLAPLADQPLEIINAWEKQSGKRVERLVLVPHKFLHVVPLHAIMTKSGTYWGDDFTIQYVPSASVLCRLVAHPSPHDGEQANNSIAVVAESPDRAFKQEGRLVASILGGSLMYGRQNTLDNVVRRIADADYVHFSCHGTYDSLSPLDSGLDCLHIDRGSEQMAHAGAARLTLGDVFEKMVLPRGPVVVLSACETGIGTIEQMQGEFMGLPAGFLYAGARTVVSSLWPVDDLATTLLMKRMWEEVVFGDTVSGALRTAQVWLRGLTTQEVRRMISLGIVPESLSNSSSMEYLNGSLDTPFANPYWWSGFTVSGLG